MNFPGRTRTLFLLTTIFLVSLLVPLVWGLVLLPTPLGWLAFLANALVLAGTALLGWFFLVQQRSHLLISFRKFVGYGVVLGYLGTNVVALTQGLLELWVASLVPGAIGSLLWWWLRLKSTESLYGYVPRPKGSPRRWWIVVADNLDALVQTLFLVVVLQQLVVQLYVIPSESMVPTLLKDDRPLVLKSLDGPLLPMSVVRVPELAPVERGQIVVFESPSYEPPSVLQQIWLKTVFFVTLSTVNLDVDEQGRPKVQTVVKRVIGVPGDKLMMVDDRLYRKTRASSQWEPLAADDLYRHVDLWNESADLRRRISEFPIDGPTRELLSSLDTLRAQADPEAWRQELLRDRQRLEALVRAQVTSPFGGAQQALRLPGEPELASWDELLGALAAPGSLAESVNLYDRSSRLVNLKLKHLAVQRYSAFLLGDSERLSALTLEARAWWFVLESTFDLRNFPEFPAGEGRYIPERQYFLLGDNRYNSLDFRFDGKGRVQRRVLDPSDPTSVTYRSMLAPRLLDRDRIVGHLLVRLWPLDRLGQVSP